MGIPAQAKSLLRGNIHQSAASPELKKLFPFQVLHDLYTTESPEWGEGEKMKKYNPWLLAFLAALFFSIYTFFVGFTNSILGSHDFRQTQTAISVRALLQGGPWLAYETPVLGPPWSIPFEFPLYQWITAILVRAAEIPIEQAGRLTSILFFLGTLPQLFLILRNLNIPRRGRFIFLSLFLTSPLYLFWSRTIMIESTALFLSVAFLACVTECCHEQSKKKLGIVLAIVFGSLAAAVKITTFATFFLASGLYVICHQYRMKTLKNLPAHWLLVFGLPILGLVSWTHFADGLKAMNPLAEHFITSKALFKWNFGTTDQRISPDLWFGVIFGRAMSDAVFSPLAFFASAFAVFIASKRWRSLFLTLFGLYLFAFICFTNLHWVHNYYAYANAIFLVLAIGLGIMSLISSPNNGIRVLGFMLFAFQVVGNIYEYKTGFLDPLQKINIPMDESLIEAVSKHSSPDDVFVIYGDDWSSVIPYMIQRKCIMDREFQPVTSPKIQRSLSNLKELRRKLGGVLVCLGAKKHISRLEENIRKLGFNPKATSFQDELCLLYTSPL
jgi:hypothetical protein